MVADVVDVDRLGLALEVEPAHLAANAGLALGDRTEGGRVGQQRLEELDGDNLAALVHHRVDTRHPHVLEHLQVLEVVIREAHPEARALEAGNELGQALELLVVHQIGVERAQPLGHLEGLLNRERLGLHKALALLPIAPLGRHLADVNLRVEVRREGMAVVARVAVDNVNLANLRDVVLLDIGAEDRRDPRVEATAQERHPPGFLKALLIGPLPLVLKLRRVQRLVVRRIQIVAPRLQARVHNVQVLIGQGNIHHQIRLEAADKRHQLGHIIRIHLRRLHGPPQLRGQGIYARLRPRREHNLGENLRHLRQLMRHHTADAAGTNHQNPHGLCPFCNPSHREDGPIVAQLPPPRTTPQKPHLSRKLRVRGSLRSREGAALPP